MKIAIDESGDTGRKFWRGSSKWFILTAVIVPDSLKCGPTCQAVHKFSNERANGREMHFSHNSHQQHVDFLSYMRQYEYIFASICIDKQHLLKTKPYVMRSKMSLLKFSFDSLFDLLQPWMADPVVVIDTNGPRHFNKALSRHLMGVFGTRHKGDIHAIKQIRSVDSSTEPLVQLADYVAGAVHHHIDGRHPHSKTFEEFVADRGKIVYI